MLTIRLQRVGRKNDPSFRVVVTDSKNGPQSGKFLEVLGSYNARFGKPQLNAGRIKHWLSVGAGVSDTVHNMLVHYNIIQGEKKSPLPPKKETPAVAVTEAPVEEKAEATEVPVETAPEAAASAEETLTEAAPEEAQA